MRIALVPMFLASFVLASCGESSSLRATYELGASFPEGGIFDAASGHFFVGDLSGGAIRALDAQTGAESLFFTETDPGTWWSLGMDLDVPNQRLVICAMDDRRADGGEGILFDGYVWVIDLASGERVANYDLGDVADDATCTDVAVAADGTIYVADRESPRIFAIDAAGAMRVLAEDPALGGSVGQNALVVLPDQSALLSLVYLPSALVLVSLTDGSVREVDIEGPFVDRAPAFSGADGMAYLNGSVWVAFTSQLTRVTPMSADWASATTNSVDVAEGMTDAIAADGDIYLLNGQALTFALGRDPDPAQLVRFDGEL